jgi:hypothetical protein
VTPHWIDYLTDRDWDQQNTGSRALTTHGTENTLRQPNRLQPTRTQPAFLGIGKKKVCRQKLIILQRLFPTLFSVQIIVTNLWVEVDQVRVVDLLESWVLLAEHCWELVLGNQVHSNVGLVPKYVRSSNGTFFSMSSIRLTGRARWCQQAVQAINVETGWGHWGAETATRP